MDLKFPKPKRQKKTAESYKTQTEELLEKAGYRCARCNRFAPLQRDHKVKRSQGGGDENENAQMLCPKCHDEKDNQPKSKSGYWRGK